MTLTIEYQVGPSAYTVHRWQGRQAVLAELFRRMSDSHVRKMRPDPLEARLDPEQAEVICAEIAHRDWRQWAAIARACGRGPRVAVDNTEVRV